jgi:serine beta-lactamase-like protein LACTB
MRQIPRVLFLSAVAVSALAESAPCQQPADNRYAELAKSLEHLIGRELRMKRLGAVSIALVDDQKIVWSSGFGFADEKAKKPATAETVYRVGSVSKLFTDIAVMQMVEQGKLDLDAPVTRYVKDFKPGDPFGKPITLRQLMAHRAGLVREPPVGHYFDDTAPSLERTVASLNDTALVLAPESKIKYSNAGIAVVGLALERSAKQPFASCLTANVLAPLGMTRSGFEPSKELMENLARATMWTYHGREFPAPPFELGMAPAGCMYSTANDLARFLSMLFAEGKGANAQVVKPDTLLQMFKPQFADEKSTSGFGLGFMIGALDGKRRIGHGGAIYGFAAELAALPEPKLGVVVIAARDCANAVVTHIADAALRGMAAIREGKPLPKIDDFPAFNPEIAKKFAGRYRAGERTIDLIESAGRLWLLPGRGGFRTEVRMKGDELVTDDALDQGLRIIPQDGKLKIGATVFERAPSPLPDPPPEKWKGLIGEYGWDHNTLYILEKDGKLHALIEWFFLYPLTELSVNEYAFPDFGLYHDERLVFTRDESGRATQVVAANVLFKRRRLDGESGSFKIVPRRPIEDLKREALAATPPRETKGSFATPELVELISLDPTLKLDIRYASNNNFLSTPLYATAKAFLQKPAAEALVRVHRNLGEDGYGLLIFDGYRPWHVTKVFWDATPAVQRLFVADPDQGSRHNRGCAVDLTLFDKATGKPVEMVGVYDEMSDRSYPDYLGGTSRQRWHRDLLRKAMEAEGFKVYEAEWWHFDYRDWKKYPILNKTFEELATGR